jgi:hypothetical protein
MHDPGEQGTGWAPRAGARQVSESGAGRGPKGQGYLGRQVFEAQDHFRLRQLLVAGQLAGPDDAFEIQRARDICDPPTRSGVIELLRIASQMHFHDAELNLPGGGLVWGFHPSFPLVRR